jgi:hypothetical protein
MNFTPRIFPSTASRALWMSFSLVFLLGCGPGFKDAEILPDEEISDTPSSGEETPGNDESSQGGDFHFGSPGTDPAFTILPDGRKLSSLRVSDSALSLSKGSGYSFTESKRQEYLALKSATQSQANHKVQWTFMDLDQHRIIEKSLSSGKKLFGASSSKIYVAATLLDRQNGELSESQLQLMADMLVVSSNSAWTNLQAQIGDGSSDKGRERIQDFTQRMGYPKTRGFQGYWGSVHGNELVPEEAVETLYDIYTGAFPGAELQWKLMHASRTGATRGRKYIPANVYVAGKTGTYDGPTENPETGATYNVAVRNHLLVFNVDGREYALAVLANSGSDESAALLAGGLIREYTDAR